MESRPLIYQGNSINQKNDSKTEHRLAPVVAEIMMALNFGIAIFAVLITLQFSNYINCSSWIICIPLFITFGVLLFYTTTKRFTKRAPLVVRIVYLLSLLTVLIFLVIVCLRFNNPLAHKLKRPNVYIVFIPLWVLLGLCLLLAGYSAHLARTRHKEHKQRRYGLISTALIITVLVLAPFFLLLQLKMVNFDIDWSVIFIPLWVVDIVCFCTSFCLLLFTVGAREDALFSVSQVITFLLILPASIAFKVLLVLYLDEITNEKIPLWAVSSPMIIVNILFVLCGLNIRFSKRK